MPVPSHWFQFDWPLKDSTPQPSKADYSEKNVAPLIESFAELLGYSHLSLEFVYENNTHENRDDDHHVRHPGDKLYLPDYLSDHASKSAAMLRYEERAKQSTILKEYQDASPANIEYFNGEW
jgi:hypothetical protein